MSGPVRPPLKTQLDNGTSSNRPVSTLAFANTDFTLTNSGTKTTIAIAGGAFDDTNKKLLVIGDSDNDTVFEIQGGDTAAGAGPRLTITNTAGTDSDIQLTCDNYAVGILSGGLGATQREVMRFGQMSSDSFTTVFNEGGLPADFRVESNGNANALFIDGNTDTVNVLGDATTATVKFSTTSTHLNDQNNNYDFRVDGEYSDNLLRTDGSTGGVGINTVPDSNLSLHVKDYNNQATVVRIESDDTDTSSSPILELRNSRAYDPAISTASIGLIKFSADTASGIETVGSIAVQQDSVVAADSTSMQFKVKRSGVEVDNFRIRYSEVVVNEDSTDCDFRVETNANAYGLHVDAATEVVGVAAIGVTGLADNNPKLQVNGSISGKVPIINTASGTTIVTLATTQIQGQVLYFEDTGAITINLPDCVTGDNIKIFKPSGNLTIATSGSNTINGALSVTRNSSATNALIEVIAVKNNTYIVDNPTR